ncbi:MAG TPA: gliding motility lipoprotein GldH [Flavobacteriaceae bacterium]|nr:gliding motility lipoprotein GldH [Flavobacteriaceae bacterium]
MYKHFFGLLLIFGILLVSCDSKQVFDEYKSLPNGWNQDSIVHFEVKQVDTSKVYDLFINIRNNNDYAYSNLFLITEMHFPQGKIITDTLEYEMAYPNGEWMGQGFSDMKENKLWYKENVRFPEIGTYKITIRQAMRENGKVNGIDNLEGITEVGFRIEKSKQ